MEDVVLHELEWPWSLGEFVVEGVGESSALELPRLLQNPRLLLPAAVCTTRPTAIYRVSGWLINPPHTPKSTPDGGECLKLQAKLQAAGTLRDRKGKVHKTTRIPATLWE